MPHLKCAGCKARLYSPASSADPVGDVCPDCGCLLEPVEELAELVGFRSIKSPDGRVEAVAPPQSETEPVNAAAAPATSEAPTATAYRDEQAERRDENARTRDLAAQVSVAAAEAHDRTARSVRFSRGDDLIQSLLADAAATRVRAAADRARAAGDRERAALDRQHAALDRNRARDELERAHLDDLTGAYRRGMGEMALRHEIARARRSNGRLVLAYVDVDRLKATNDTHGHAAGDDLLRDVVAVLRSKLRPYDPIVRVGGDEFVCAMADIGLGAARLRFDEVQRALEGGSVTVGLTALRPGDSVADLTARGDAELRRTRAGRGRVVELIRH